MNKTTKTVEYDAEHDDWILTFSEEELAELGWKENDELEWIDNQDGSYTLRLADPQTLDKGATR